MFACSDKPLFISGPWQFAFNRYGMLQQVPFLVFLIHFIFLGRGGYSSELDYIRPLWVEHMHDFYTVEDGYEDMHKFHQTNMNDMQTFLFLPFNSQFLSEAEAVSECCVYIYLFIFLTTFSSVSKYLSL